MSSSLISHAFPAANSDRLDCNISPTYNWGNAQAPTDTGNALAVTYRTMRTAGQILAQHVSSDDENQYLDRRLLRRRRAVLTL